MGFLNWLRGSNTRTAANHAISSGYSFFFGGTTSGRPATERSGLESRRILTPRGKTVWSTSTVRSILSNEKYKGDALLQKTFTTDFLTKKMKVNEGEVPQYYVAGDHEAIIDPAVWDQAQYAALEAQHQKTAARKQALDADIAAKHAKHAAVTTALQ